MPASRTREPLRYALEYSPWPEKQLPEGWQQAWRVPTGACSEAASTCAVTELPIVVYVSSLSGDRRAAKNSRWALDFLVGKKVPHAVVDLSVYPQVRSHLLAQLLARELPAAASGATPAAMAYSEVAQAEARARAEAALAELPVIDLGGARLLSVGEMIDSEDHGELDPLLQHAITARFATTPGK